jgi:stage V sporulation protein SpoVS
VVVSLVAATSNPGTVVGTMAAVITVTAIINLVGKGFDAQTVRRLTIRGRVIVTAVVSYSRRKRNLAANVLHL